MKLAARCALFLYWILAITPGALLAEDTTGLQVTEQKDAAGGVTLMAENRYQTEFTVTVQCDLENATASPAAPATFVSAGRQAFPLVHILRNDTALPWHYTYTFKWKPGAPRATVSNDFVYTLPFKAGEGHRLLQGNFGKFSHYPGSQDEYAVDWEAQAGTIVCAARAGIVTGVREDSDQGGADASFRPAANYIIVKHADGTYAEYYHLQKGGALVHLGDKVTARQPIGHSGNTGWTSVPHIHFAVFQAIDGDHRVTLPTSYLTAGGVVTKLEQGKTYSY